MTPDQSTVSKKTLRQGKPMAVRMVERFATDKAGLAPLLKSLTDVTAYWSVRVFFTCEGIPTGFVDIANEYQPISGALLTQSIDTHLGLREAQAAEQETAEPKNGKKKR